MLQNSPLFGLLLLLFLVLTPSKAALPVRSVTTTKYTGCISHFNNCQYSCPRVSAVDELCEYSGWQYCSTVLTKKCKCACTRQLTLSPCLTAEIEGYASSGTYDLTDQLYNGKNVYKRRSDQGHIRWIYWHGDMWKIYTELGGNPYFVLCAHDQLKDCDGSSGYFKVTRCDSLWRQDNRCGGSYMAAAFPYQPAICNTAGPYPCCGANNQCGNSQGSCWCESCLNYAEVEQSCVLEEVTRLPDHCDITPLDLVDRQISTQMLWNVAGVLAGSIPLVGPIFDSYFAVLDPMGPVTSPADLTNSVISAVNQQITALQKCMDQQITNVKVELLENNFKEIIRQSSLCEGYRDNEKKTCIQQLSQDFYGKLGTFEEPAASYLEYEKLLPIFEAVYPLWFATVAGRLGDLRQDPNGCNYNEFLEHVIEGTNILKVWGEWALNSIVQQLTPPTGFDVNSCHRDGGDHENIWTIYTNKNYLYAVEHRWSAGGDGGRGTSSMDVFLKMTEQTNYWCQFYKEGSFMLNANDQLRCDVMKSEARKIVNTMKNRLTHEYRPAFKKKFIENVDKFLQSLKAVPQEPCVRKNDESDLVKSRPWKTKTQVERHGAVSYKNHTRFSAEHYVYSETTRGGWVGSHGIEGRMKWIVLVSVIAVGMMLLSGGAYLIMIMKRRWKYERIIGQSILQL